MRKLLSLALVVVMLTMALVGCPAPAPTPTPGGGDDLTGTYDITMWVSEKDGVADMFQAEIDKFEAANPGVVINATIAGVSEGQAGSNVLNDVASAPDIYCFAQDQLARLVQASALAPLGTNAAAAIRANNDAGSVSAATVGGTLYAYPLTSDNGYYMYYDKSVISEDDLDSLEAIVAACEAAGKKIRYNLEDAWYTASFFFATGCYNNWTMDADGNFNNVEDNFNSDKGLAAMKGMQILTNSTAYDKDANVFTDAAVVITGIWNAGAAATAFEENLGATDLPSFTVDGETYHLGSFSGNKLMGVKPQTDAKRQAVLSLLAQYLTNEESQAEHYAKFEWGPSNKNAQASDAVQANVSLAALAKQSNYAIAQGQIHGGWWDLAKVLGADADNATSEQDLRDALQVYEDAIKALLTQSDEDKMRWSVIGGIMESGWNTDFPMTEKGEGVWESEALTFNEGEIFKLRRGAAWDVQVGADGQMKTPEIEPGNITAEATGTFIVRLTWDGVSTTATVELIPA